MKNRLFELEQSLSQSKQSAQMRLSEAKTLYAQQFDKLADEVLAKLPAWLKDKIGIRPNGELDFRRNLYDPRWDDAQNAIDRMAAGSYAIFGARIAVVPTNFNQDEFSKNDILIMMPKKVKMVPISSLSQYANFDAFEKGLISAGVPIRAGGFFNYTKSYYEWIAKMYSPQFSLAQEKTLPPEVKFYGASQDPYIDVKPPPGYLYLSAEMIANLKGLRGADHDVPISLIIEAANNAMNRKAADEPGSSDAFFYQIQQPDASGQPKILTRHLCLVLSKRRDNLVTAYFTSQSQVMSKLGLRSPTEYEMRFRDRKKLTMPA
ncbi:MAG: hypothetical protein MUF72_04575 [Elainella sp. Prado103]|nr:hypothetical protein [Elainella sp. Prado103]